MGIIVSYRIVSDENAIKAIEKNMNTEVDIESILNQYAHCIKSFTSFVKTWDPLYCLLNKISGNSIFTKLKENKQSENINEYSKIFHKDEIKILYEELQKISIEVLNNKLSNESLKLDISQQQGYSMISIYNADCIIIKFQELKKAVNTAFNNNSKIVQILFP